MNPSKIFSFFAASAIFVVCSLQTLQTRAEGVLDVMKMKAIEQSVQTPVELFWKDLWDLTFHRQGNKVWKKLGFMMGRAGKYKICRAISTVIMWELRQQLFDKGENYNVRAWDKIEMEFEKLLREWWVQNPLDPFSSLDVGVWKCLVKLYSAWLEPNLRGSRKLKVLQDIILDPNLVIIKQWTDKPHVDIIRNGGSRAAKFSALQSLSRRKPTAKADEEQSEMSRNTEESSSD